MIEVLKKSVDVSMLVLATVVLSNFLVSQATDRFGVAERATDADTPSVSATIPQVEKIQDNQ